MPKDLAGFGDETENIAPFADGEDMIAIEGRRRSWAALVIYRAEFGIVGMVPQLATIGGVETPDRVAVVAIAHCVKPSVPHRDTGKAGAHGSTPPDFGSV